MKKLILTFICLINIAGAYANIPSQSPVGYWQTIDDVSGEPKAIVKIERLANETLIGRIIKIFPRPGHDQNEICKSCKGEKHNQPIVGMQIMENLQPKKDDQQAWINGKILDPNNGSVYNCNIQLIEKESKLRVRGYLGLPLFGRSQTWVRVEETG